MISIKPLNYNELKRFYDIEKAEKENRLDEAKEAIRKQLVTVELPFTFYNYNKKSKKLIPVNNLTCNMYIAYAVKDALKEILQYYGLEKIKELGLDLEFGGSFNFRKTRNGKWWSVHAWSMAVDLWCHMGRMGEKPIIPEFCVQAFKNRGFFWGGDFPSPVDGMHFSCCFG